MLDLPITVTGSGGTPPTPTPPAADTADSSSPNPEGATPALGPLQQLLQSGLPTTLTSLTLRLSAPHLAFLAPPQPQLAALTLLSLSNYAGESGAHAWALVSGLPGLQSLSLRWPSRSQNRRPSQQQQQQPGGGQGGAPIGLSLPDGAGPSEGMSFWGEIGRQCGGRLKSLRVELEADVLPGVLDITDCLPALKVGAGHPRLPARTEGECWAAWCAGHPRLPDLTDGE